MVFPVHPRVRGSLDELPKAPGLRLVDPVGYVDFLALEAHALGVDHRFRWRSGRDELPRRPLLHRPRQHRAAGDVERGTNTLLGLDPRALLRVPALLDAAGARMRPAIPGWDGHASERLAEILAAELAHDGPLVAAAPA